MFVCSTDRLITYGMEDDMGVFRKRLELVEVLVRSTNDLYRELRLQDLGLLLITDEGGDVKCAGAGMLEETFEDRASDIPYSA